MISFLFEQYGYYPGKLENDRFIIDNWEFKLIEVDCNEETIENIIEYGEKIKLYFNNKGPFIIKTRFNKNISEYDNKKYVLLSVDKSNMTFKDLNKFHCLFIEENKNVNLNDLLLLWKNRIGEIEDKAVNSFRVDSIYYKNNLEKTMFCFGLAQNALQYLSDAILEYGDTIKNITLTHKRLKSLDSFEFFNPFNLVLDHPIRDVVNLYKNNYLFFDDMLEILEYYEINNQLATVFMSRILYPSDFLDLLEENLLKKDVNFNISYNIEKEVQKAKKIYIYLRKKYNIRPINWLDA